MFDAPVDAWYVWLGVALASTVAFGLAASLPSAPPPDAASAADAVDSVAASDYAATRKVPLAADAVKLGPERVALRRDGAVSHATFAYGPVTPAAPGTPLWNVLRGTPPDRAFASPAEWRTWERGDELTVRRVSWEGVDVALVG
ncbi:MULTISPECIES: DUF7283 family protein [Halorussus]|uniref:DUF7283 family protein n=1 Tax=Halorussus TaxID=1070314 RepID=UPI00209FE212|nr:hypothetical protein [Halorussus vallis]USZ75403.1 hypothetical protein NGM07_18465 [Halorussus vallis]